MTSKKALIGFFGLLFALVVLKDAWVSEDAYITFRTVDNFVHGHGLTWNTSERVQAYTHPLWMFLVSAVYACSNEIFYTSIFLSAAISLAAVLLFAFKLARTPIAAIFGLTVLTLSKAFVDYSTSGLENPLTHLILALFFLVYLKASDFDFKTLTLLALIGALGTINRMDTVLFFLPALAYACWQGRRLRGVYALLLGFLPFLLWECFSLLYYGFSFPNTAYAELNTGISGLDLAAQSLYYFANSLEMDPLTLPVILCGFIIPFVLKEKRHLALAAGSFCYLIYVVKIGGDFMSGRFFTASLFCAVTLLTASPPISLRSGLLAVSAAVLLGLCSPYSPVRTGSDYGLDPEHIKFRRGIADERAFYFQYASLIKAEENRGEPQYVYAIRGRRQIRLRQDHEKAPLVSGNVGYYGFYAGPGSDIVDRHALTDPLLARLPTINTGNWRIGHFKRTIPNGYLKTLATGKNHIVNPGLSAYYDRLSQVTRGDLFDPNRWVEIWNLNTGKHDHLIQPQFEFARYHSLASLLSTQGRPGEALDAQKKAVSIDPTRSEGWCALSRIHRHMGKLKEAYTALARAIALNPGNLNYRIEYLNLGKAYHDRGETDKAFTIYKEARTTAPLVEVYLSSGDLLYEQGYLNRALDIYRKVLNGKLKTARYSRRPNSDLALRYRQKRLAVARFNIARILYDKGKIEEAVHECEQALTLDPTHPEAKRKLQTLLASL